MACRVDAARFVKPAAPADVMLRHYAASNELLLGHVTDQMSKHGEAIVHYIQGARPLPDDEALRRLVRQTYFRQGLPPRPKGEADAE